MKTSEMTPRALTAAALSGRIERQYLDPADQLACIEAMRRRLGQAEDEMITLMRLGRATWADVGALYGITRQAAQMKFSDRPAGTLDKLRDLD